MPNLLSQGCYNLDGTLQTITKFCKTGIKDLKTIVIVRKSYKKKEKKKQDSISIYFKYIHQKKHIQIIDICKFGNE